MSSNNCEINYRTFSKISDVDIIKFDLPTLHRICQKAELNDEHNSGYPINMIFNMFNDIKSWEERYYQYFMHNSTEFCLRLLRDLDEVVNALHSTGEF